MRSCAQCGGGVAVEHRFCPWCAAPQRLKLVRFFPAHTAIEADRGKMLRLSFYVGIPGDEQHVRFSVWNEEGVAEAAVSLSPAEARRGASQPSSSIPVAHSRDGSPGSWSSSAQTSSGHSPGAGGRRWS